VKEAIDGMWSKGYVTTTGGCECVGMAGAALGGGHGRFEGLYGLISDNILQYNVVLADGSAIRVNSKNYSDLFWGMKGAGHNFGIVTSFEMNIWPKGPETYHYHNYVWRGDKLEAVFTALNNLHNNGNTPVAMAFEAGSFLINTTVSATEPILYWSFVYRGSAQDAEKLLAPFNAIEHVSDTMGDVPYPQVAAAQGTDMNAPICQHGDYHRTSTVFLRRFNATAERQIFEGYKRRMAEDPELVEGSFIMHEGYSTKGVDAVDSASTAYPFRADRHLTLFNAVVPHNDPAREAKAAAWAEEVRQQWAAGQPGIPIDAYVNYANGLETVEERYGHEQWRIDRLRGLKAKYDPQNRFRFFNPIVA
jgi:FAD/FMN-containing dehydrogenase